MHEFSEVNIGAIIKLYFYDKGISNINIHGDLNYIYINEDKLSINEFEFICKKVSENLTFFKTNLSINSLTISNLIKYGIDAYKLNLNGSINRNRITQEFRNLIFNNRI